VIQPAGNTIKTAIAYAEEAIALQNP